MEKDNKDWENLAISEGRAKAIMNKLDKIVERLDVLISKL